MQNLSDDLKKLRNQALDSLIGMPKLLNLPPLKELKQSYPKEIINDITRRELQALRDFILNANEKELQQVNTDPTELAKKTAELIRIEYRQSVAPAVNATGIILHTALGRAPLCPEAQEAVLAAVKNYCTVAIDRQSGKRGDRYAHVESLLCKLTGAEAALVVNNNAGATMLVLNAMGENREVIVSRGQLVEIGGSFRIPDVMKRSGATMVDVGTTNKTHLRDYREAITEETSVLLRVHTSNYKIIGFASEVPLGELVELGREVDLPVVDDIGSGCLIDFRKYGLPAEPTVQDSIKTGADIVTFSGDKILSGPQCGIIIGKKKYIEAIKKNPLARALRSCKLTYAALEATLKIYLDKEHLAERHPVLHMLTLENKTLVNRARAFRRRLKDQLEGKCVLALMDGYSQLGSGSLPGKNLPSKLVALRPVEISPEVLANALRAFEIPVFPRITDNEVLLDFRTIDKDEIKIVEQALLKIFES